VRQTFVGVALGDSAPNQDVLTVLGKEPDT
jgi:hypothetical protein